MQEWFRWWQRSDRYKISLFPHLHSPVPNKPYGFCGRKAPWKEKAGPARVQELCESRGGRPGLPGPSNPYGLCGRKATLNLNRPSIRMKKKKMVPQSEEGEANLFAKERNDCSE